MMKRTKYLSLILMTFLGTSVAANEQLQYHDLYSPKENYVSHTDQIYPFKELGIRYFSNYTRHAVPLSEEFTFEKLVEVINKKGLKTIESVIEELPDSMKNDNYVLMYRSRSLQAATPKSPRALLYTPTASFVLTFNGGGLQRGGNTIEAIQFRYDQKKFEFRELQFDGANTPQVSGPNPAKCMECHQSSTRKNVDMRPNWEPYSTWLGAYGSDAGRLIGGPLNKDFSFKKIIQPQDHETLEEQAQEFNLFKTYINEIAPKHPRFSRLGSMNIHAPTELTDHLSFLNMIRVSRLITEQKEIYAHYKDALNFTILCYSPSSLAQSDAMKWHLGFNYPQYYEGRGRQLNELRSISAVLTMIFEPLGVDTSDWSMDFGTGGRFARTERFGTPVSLQRTLTEAWKWSVKEVAEYDGIKCDNFKASALRSMDSAWSRGFQIQMRTKNLSQISVPTAHDLVNRCSRCHVEDQYLGVPYIPFDRPDLLSSALKKSLFENIRYRTSEMAVRKDQMPPSGRLNSTERKILMNYLKNVQNGQKEF